MGLHHRIHELSAAREGGIVAAAEAVFIVHVWNVERSRKLIGFHTIFGFGGHRLRLSPDGSCCYTGSYTKRQVACYAVADGSETWVSDHIGQVQRVRLSHDGGRLYCSLDSRSTVVLDSTTGAAVARLRGVWDVHDSPWGALRLVEREDLALEADDGKRLWTLQRSSFAVLAVAMSETAVCICEAGGMLRMVGIASPTSGWTYHTPKGTHVLRVWYDSGANAFIGVNDAYEHGGPSSLLRFDARTREPQTVCSLPRADYEFVPALGYLVSTNGDVIDATTGQFLEPLQF